MAKKDYAAELAELRERLEKAEQEAAEYLRRFERANTACEQIASKNECLTRDLAAAKVEVMKVKAHAYDLMMEQESAETA